MKSQSLIITSVFAVLFATASQAVTVLSTDFTSIPAQMNIAGTNWATATVETSAAAFPGLTHTFVDVHSFGVTGNWLQVSANTGNAIVNTATITLTGLGSHTAISLGMFLAAGGGIDGTPQNDSFAIIVDGSPVFDHTFAERGVAQSYVPPSGVQLLAPANADTGGSDFLSARSAGWGHDALYDLSLDPALQNIPHTGSTATIQIISRLSDGGGGMEVNNDEQIAIANLNISINSVPEPAAAMCSVLAAGALLSTRRRRKA